MPQPLQLLIAEDNPADVDLLLRALRQAGFDPQWKAVDNEQDFVRSLHAGLELVISDYEMPQFTGLRALELVQRHQPNLPFIIVSGTIGEETAVATVRLGAIDYLLKDRLGRLGQAVKQALAQARLKWQQRRDELALRASEESLARAQHIAHIGSWEMELTSLTDLDANPLRCSDELFRIFGYEPGMVAANNENFFRRVHPDDQEKIQAAVNVTLGTGRIYNLEHRILRPDGTERVVHELANLVCDAAGHPIRLVGTTQDITERKLAENALQESADFVADVLDSLTAEIAVLDGEGVITSVNRAWRDFARENGGSDCLGQSYLAACVAGTRSMGDPEARAAHAGIRQILEGAQEEFTLEYPCHSPAEKRWFLLRVTPYSGSRRGAVVAHMNITGRKQAEEKIGEQLAELLRWQEIMLGREDRVQALKTEINSLLAQQGQPPRYSAPPPTHESPPAGA